MVVEILQERSEATQANGDRVAKMGLSDLTKLRGDLVSGLLAKRHCLDAESAAEVVDGLVDWVAVVANGPLNRMPLNREVQPAPSPRSIWT